MSAPREPMVQKNLRVPPMLWNEADAIAASRGESMSEILRAGLRKYIQEHKES